MNKNETMEEKIENLEKQLWYLKNSIESKGDSGGNAGSTPSGNDENWTVLYDKDDENLNYGYTNGLVGNSGIINEFPDIANYHNKIRVYFAASTLTAIYDFDISDYGGKNHTMLLSTIDGLSLISLSIIVNTVNGKRIFEVGVCRRIDFATNKYPTLKNLKTDKEHYIKKILIC